MTNDRARAGFNRQIHRHSKQLASSCCFTCITMPVLGDRTPVSPEQVVFDSAPVTAVEDSRSGSRISQAEAERAGDDVRDVTMLITGFGVSIKTE